MPNDASVPLPVRRSPELLVYPTDDTTDSRQKHVPARSPGTLPPPPALRRLRLRCRLPLRALQDSPRLQHNRTRFCAVPPEIPSIKIPVRKIPSVSGPMAGTSTDTGQTRGMVLPLLVDMGPTGTVMRARARLLCRRCQGAAGRGPSPPTCRTPGAAAPAAAWLPETAPRRRAMQSSPAITYMFTTMSVSNTELRTLSRGRRNQRLAAAPHLAHPSFNVNVRGLVIASCCSAAVASPLQLVGNCRIMCLVKQTSSPVAAPPAGLDGLRCTRIWLLLSRLPSKICFNESLVPAQRCQDREVDVK